MKYEVDISFSSLQGIACHQEMVIRHLKGDEGEGFTRIQALKEAEIVLDSLDRMIEAHPNMASFRKAHAVFGGRLPKEKESPCPDAQCPRCEEEE